MKEQSVSEYQHDQAGRLTRYKQTIAGLTGTKEFGYTYFAGDAVAEQEYPSGRRVASCPDELGREKWVSGAQTSAVCLSGGAVTASTAYVSGVSYAAGGGMAQWTLGSGRVGAAKYNERDQPVRMRLSAASNAEALCGATGDEWCIELGYGSAAGNNGNVREQKIWAAKGNGGFLNLAQSYDFDGLNRLTVFGESVLSGGSSGGNWSQTNGYDRWGNRWAASTVSQSFWTPGLQSWIDGATNRVVTATNGAVTYLTSGEMQSHPQVGTLTWDVEGRMRSAGGAVYAYDGNGVRVKKTAGGVTTFYVADGMGRVGAEYGGLAAGGGRRYVTADHLGSTRVVSNQAGTVTARCDYGAFGETLTATAALGNRDGIGTYGCGDGVTGARYTGKERDSETGLDYFGARYLGAGMGRFVSPDPLLSSAHITAPQSWNRYAYTLNNPLRFTDPHGLYVCNGTNAECKDFESALKQVERARNSFKKGSAEYNALNGSLQAYGKKGVDNGVTVQFGATKSGGASDTSIGIAVAAGTGNKVVTADNPSGQNTVVTFDLSKNSGSGLLAVSAAHEGVHVGDGTALVGALPMDLTSGAAAGILSGPLNLTKYATELSAYGASSFIGQGLGFGSLKVSGNFEIWNSGWKAADVNTLRSNGINGVLSDPNGLYKVTPGAPGKKLIE